MTDIYLGRFVKAFGIRGEIKFHPTSDFWEATLESKHLKFGIVDGKEVVTRPVVFKTVRPHGNSYVVVIDGVDDRNSAEELIGAEIFIEESDIDVEMPEYPLPFQLMGLTVKDEEGETLGELTGIMQSGAHDVYEVKGGEKDFLVPAVPEFVVSIDLDEGEMVLRPIPGLIEDEQ